jgi:hypothetical protein
LKSSSAMNVSCMRAESSIVGKGGKEGQTVAGDSYWRRKIPTRLLMS